MGHGRQVMEDLSEARGAPEFSYGGGNVGAALTGYEQLTIIQEGARFVEVSTAANADSQSQVSGEKNAPKTTPEKQRESRNG